MNSKRHSAAISSYIAIALTCALLSGCAETGGAEPAKKQSANQIDPDVPSGHRILSARDIAEFKPGRSTDEILKSIQWRGNFEMGCEHNGKGLVAISYGLTREDYLKSPSIVLSPESEEEVVWAIFVGDKFVKFVEWPEWLSNPALGNKAEGTHTTIGDYDRLTKALESKPLDISRLEKDVKSRPEAPSQVDPGLTVAWLVLRGRFKTTEPGKQYKENAELRDRYNAARVRIGMDESEVQKTFVDKPIDSGKTKSGEYKLYGSADSFDLVHSLHFSNVLIEYRAGKVYGIYSGETLSGWNNDAISIVNGEIRWK